MSNKNVWISALLEKDMDVWNIKNETPFVKIKEERVNPEPRMTVNKMTEKFFK